MSKVNFDFSGENYIVTGASSGMGRQIAGDLADAGARVLAIGRNEIRLGELRENHPRITIASVDVCDYEGMQEAVNTFVNENGKLNGGVYAAGITTLTTLRSYAEDEARKIIDTNFWAGIKFIQVCTKAKLANKEASFVLFSSVQALKTDKGVFAYACSKSAIQTAVKSFAKELGPKRIRVNSVCPGWVHTGMTNGLNDIRNLDELNSSTILGMGNPADVGHVVMFMLSDAAKWITGTNLIVDGGYLA